MSSSRQCTAHVRARSCHSSNRGRRVVVALGRQATRDVARLARAHVRVGVGGPDRAHLVVVHHHLVQPDELMAVLREQRCPLLAHRVQIVERGARPHLGELVHEQRTA